MTGGDSDTKTADATAPHGSGAGRAIPGLVQVWNHAGPTFRVLPVAGGVTLGRSGARVIALGDRRTSRTHCHVVTSRGSWQLTDLDSHNGTFVDGARVTGTVRVKAPRVLRAGHCLLLPRADVRPLRGTVETGPKGVFGPRQQALRASIAGAALDSPTLLITGPTGAGKELAARHFHASGPARGGPFVALNCAAIPRELAERVLFGTLRGAYSGAHAKAEGYLQAAHGGVLFLDEIGELDLEIQAKLLRFLETREVYPLGATRPRTVDARVCLATHRDLRSMVQTRRFREDLYFRIGQPRVVLSGLAQRAEELPWLIQRALADDANGTLAAHPLLVEACLLRPWPGNTRELLAAIQTAARHARANGSSRVDAGALDPDAGQPLAATPPADAPAPAVSKERLDDRDGVLEVLRDEKGNVSRSAERLGVHRNQLRRWMSRNAIDPREFRE